ncbi:hypothetical protein [Butyrivibrio sp. MC2021]|uniref:hypothetical protein n=1 Tax=Butyrivibrio sp. MC2021 TaxID=1408306 RepID=UPI00047BDD0E|nr:hypothetical protein [Butyrivibrio sp. MC2021]
MKAGTDYEVFFHPFTGEGEDAAPDFTKKLTAADIKSKGAGTYLINFEGKGNFTGVFATEEKYSQAPVLRVIDKEQSKKEGILFLNDAKKLTIKSEQYNETVEGTPDVLSQNVISKFADGTYTVKVGGKELVYVAPGKAANYKSEGYYFTVSDPADTDENLNRYPVSGNYVTLVPADTEKNKLEGELKAAFEITGKEIDVTDIATKISYTGTPLLEDRDTLLTRLAKKGTTTAKVIVKKDSTKTAVSSDSYYVSASGDYGDPGTVTLTFKGNPLKGMTGTVTKKVTVTPRKITDADLKSGDIKVVFTETESSDAITVPYSKGGATAAVDVMVKDADGEYIYLNEGEDYSVKYSGNKSISTGSDKAKVSIKFKGYYSGSLKNALNFTVDKAEFDLGTIKAEAPDKIYNIKGKKNYFKSIPALYDGTEKLTKADYELVGDYRYFIGDEEITNADAKSVPQDSKITVKFTAKLKDGSKNYKAVAAGGTVDFSAIYYLGSYNMSKCKVSIEPQSYNDGWAITPDPKDITITIKANGTTVTAKEGDYEIVSVTNNQKVGTATIILKGKGRFCGTKKATFKIVKPKN